MKAIDSIQIQVEQRATELSSHDIIDRLFEQLRKGHIYVSNHGKSNGCQCKYCQSLREYVVSKLTHHRVKRRFTNYDIDMTPEEMEIEQKRLDSLNQLVHHCRQIKNEAKT